MLIVVTRALVDKRELIDFGRDEVLAVAAPYVYRADLGIAETTAFENQDH